MSNKHLPVYPHTLTTTRTKTIGNYTIVEGKLDKEDSRGAYAIGTVVGGRRAPIASFWSYGEGIRWAKEQ